MSENKSKIPSHYAYSENIQNFGSGHISRKDTIFCHFKEFVLKQSPLYIEEDIQKTIQLAYDQSKENLLLINSRNSTQKRVVLLNQLKTREDMHNPYSAHGILLSTQNFFSV